MAQLAHVVLGQGLTAISTARYLLGQGNSVVILSRKPNLLPKDLQSLYSQSTHSPLQYWLSPGIHPQDEIWDYLRPGVPIMLDVEYYLLHQTSRVIAVTGTNGKSTLCVYLADALKQQGFTVGIYSNFQPGLLQSIQQSPDFVIIELSSFQLHYMSMQYQVEITAITNIEQDHQNWHKNICAYQSSKKKIFQLSSVCKMLDEYQSKKSIREQNLLLTELVMTSLGYDFDPNLITASLPYRLQKHHQYRIYNDSKSTNLHATCAALSDLLVQYHKVILILSGIDKGCCNQRLLYFLSQYKIDLYLVGDGFKLLEDSCIKRFIDLESCIESLDLNEVILFSPGGSSYDQYKDYIDRGRHFDTIIESILEGA
ncbi:Mur ligase family protein [Gammaproteobacteria bacterium]|nr:Mur ligase family protein [Gammaproteobacteria bacterium]